MPLTNAPSEGLPPGCTCVLMAPGTVYEARALNPECRVHNPAGSRVKKYCHVTRKRNGF